MATPSIVDKKRGRPLEEFSHARKKIASELMAFEFQSLSLSNGDGSVIQDGSPSSGSQLRRHPPVQQQSAQQQHQHQLDQNEAQFATVPPQDIQQHDRVQTKALQNPDMHNERLQQQQRGRAKSSPIAPARTILDHAVEILPEQRTDQSPDAPTVEYEYDTQMQANSSSDSPGFNGAVMCNQSERVVIEMKVH
ncbi:hypothetical protein BGZ54_005336 [Gamsiella multidivaricata]|nr:hypothetical protein BGZ54_005336 [Gamsiella multidivaricata]